MSNRTTKYRVTEVQWDTDGYDVDLPREFVVELEPSEDSELLLSDWLSDTTGYCHHGFVFQQLN